MRLHVRVQGQGADLVLLHGWAMHSGVFDDLLPALTRSYRVHCIDLPGHGHSAYHHEMNSIDALTEAVKPYVPQKAIVLGWSLGGQVALQIAHQMPLSALVLVSTTPKFIASEDWSAGMTQGVFTQFFTRLHENHLMTVQDFLTLQVRGDLQASETLSRLRETLLQCPPETEALYDGLTILRDVDLRDVLPQLNIPTLVISGEYDRITHPSAGEYLAKAMQQAQFALCKRAGHAPFISHQSWFIARLQEFLQTVPTI